MVDHRPGDIYAQNGRSHPLEKWYVPLLIVIFGLTYIAPTGMLLAGVQAFRDLPMLIFIAPGVGNSLMGALSTFVAYQMSKGTRAEENKHEPATQEQKAPELPILVILVVVPGGPT